jgi:SAM-dependent methyltransferase
VSEWWRTFFDATYRSLWSGRTGLERTLADVEGIEAVLDRHEVPRPARVLDLACGDGRVAVALARRGHVVTGLDLSASMLAAARERADANGVAIELVEADMRLAHTIPARFDVVLNWFSAFGCFEEAADDLEVLESVRRSLEPRGVLVLETTHRDLIASRHADLSPTRDYEDRDGWVMLQERWFDPVSGRAGERLRITSPDGAVERRDFSMRSYTATELVALCRAADLHVEGVYGGPGPTPFGVGTRLLIVARRGPS